MLSGYLFYIHGGKIAASPQELDILEDSHIYHEQGNSDMAANQHSTIKPVRAKIALGGYDLNVFMLHDGTYRLSQSQATEAIGLDESRFRRWIKPKDEIVVEKFTVGGSKGKASLVSVDVAIEYWKHEARNGCLGARSLLDVISKYSIPPFEKYNSLDVIYVKPNKTPKQLESSCVKRLQEKLGGEREVPTKAGLIDLLTSTEIIEVKRVKDWKGALGQVEVYGDYYPSHQKRIHLFGSCHDSYLETVRYHCSKRGIVLTWEA